MTDRPQDWGDFAVPSPGSEERRQVATVRPESTSTLGMSGEDAMGLWQDLIADYQCLMSYEFAEGREFRAQAFRGRTALHQFVSWSSDSVVYRRKHAHIRKDGCDSYRLLVPLSGVLTLDQASRQVRLPTGTASLLTFSQPFLLHNTVQAQQVALTLDRDQIDARINGPATVAHPLDLTTGLGSVVHSLLHSLLDQHRSLTPSEFNAVADRLVELLCLVLAGDARPTVSGQLAQVEAAVHRYVRLHAEESDLNGESMARALGWSLRQVQLALKEAGTTPREVIREERLALARDRLTSAAFSQVSISEMAHRCGFTSVSAFSTAFRQRFGISPRELRRVHREGAYQRPARDSNCG
ncbi:AraC family transcriptional regulator [Nocardiopsis oceani]